jgi:hyperosmotically inducible periplasmic protein
MQVHLSFEATASELTGDEKVRITKKILQVLSMVLLAGSLFAATTNLDAVRNQIQDKAHIQNLQIEQTNNGVQLLGTAALLKDKLKAEDIAKDKLGSNVTSNITVQAPQQSDREITVNVIDNIRRELPSKFLFNNLSAETHNGNVILSGQLRDAYLADQAIDAAAEVPGVQSVINKMQVAPPSLSDDRLRIAILRRLYRDGTLVNSLTGAQPSMSILVNSGRVTLVGVVNSNVEKMKAETIARSTPGVLNVSNQITVE